MQNRTILEIKRNGQKSCVHLRTPVAWYCISFSATMARRKILFWRTLKCLVAVVGVVGVVAGVVVVVVVVDVAFVAVKTRLETRIVQFMLEQNNVIVFH